MTKVSNIRLLIVLVFLFLCTIYMITFSSHADRRGIGVTGGTIDIFDDLKYLIFFILPAAPYDSISLYKFAAWLIMVVSFVMLFGFVLLRLRKSVNIQDVESIDKEIEQDVGTMQNDLGLAEVKKINKLKKQQSAENKSG